MTMAARPTLGFLGRATLGMTRVRVLDVGFGDGDMLRRIARWAARRGIAAELVGVDLNPRSERAARLHTPPGLAIRSEEHTSELQSLMRISDAVFFLKTKNTLTYDLLNRNIISRH